MKKEEKKKRKIVKLIAGTVGSLIVSGAAFYLMPKIQKKMADELYEKTK